MRFVLFLIATLWTVTAHAAAPMSPEVEAMIRTAAENDELDAVANTAKKAFPDSAESIDALVTTLKEDAERRRVAKLRRAGFFDGWSGEGEVGVSHTTGNTHDTGALLSYELRKEGLHFRHKFSGLVDWQRSNGTVTRNRYIADYELNYKFNDHLYMYGLAAWERNTFAGFRWRLSESFGAGYTVLSGPNMSLDLTAGPAFQQTRNVDNTYESTVSGRASIDFSWHIRDNLTFSERVSYYVGNQLASTTALTANIYESLAGRLSFDIIREDDPPVGREAIDTRSRLSLVYSF